MHCKKSICLAFVFFFFNICVRDTICSAALRLIDNKPRALIVKGKTHWPASSGASAWVLQLPCRKGKGCGKQQQQLEL